MKTTIIAVCLLATTTLYAQTFEWARSFGGPSSDLQGFIAIDAEGNVYTTGTFQDTVDFDPGTGTTKLISAGSRDVIVQKMDAAGNFLWAKSFGGTSIDRSSAISVDASGNVYTTGRFRDMVDFDPGAGTTNLTSVGDEDMFVQKLDADGNFLWARSFGGTFSDRCYSIDLDASGNVYITGRFEGTVDFDPGADTTILTAVDDDDIFVLKMDATGNFLWARSFGGTSFDQGSSISVDALGNVYTSGYFQDTVDFDPGAGITNLTSVDGEDIFVQKMDTDGNFLWARSFGGIFNDEGISISIDASGNVYTTGHFEETVDFDPGAGITNLTAVDREDIFVQKMDADGNFLWARSFGSAGEDVGIAISLDASGNVYTTGYFEETVDFDPGAGITNLISVGDEDIFVQKMDADGNFLWAISSGGIYNDWGSSIQVDALGNIYLSGDFEETVDFDPGADTTNLTAVGDLDIFVQKLSQCLPTSGTDVITACDSYTWIDGKTYIASINTVTHILTNAAGCDSVVTLNLTINRVSDITTSTSDMIITANNNNATYQWLDCDNNNALIAGETGQTFTATSNGNYAVELTENGCVDTSACVTITTVGLLEIGFDNQVLVYPNPSSGLVQLSFEKALSNVAIEVTDVLGKVIYSKQYDAVSNEQINIAGSAGIYFLSIKSPYGQRVLKLVKE